MNRSLPLKQLMDIYIEKTGNVKKIKLYKIIYIIYINLYIFIKKILIYCKFYLFNNTNH